MPARDTAVTDLSFETLWIVIDEDGGYLTDGFDATVIDSTRIPLYGSYGPFRNNSDSELVGGSVANLSPPPPGGGEDNPTPGARMRGYARYYNEDTGG